MIEKLLSLHKNKTNFDFLSKDELITILKTWNKTQHTYQKTLTIPMAFQNLAKTAPNNIAVMFEDISLSYDELNNRANKIANYLLTIGIKQEQIIAICMDRSIEVIIGILGILKAGGAYLPISPDYPKERLEFILKDSNTQIILTQNKLKNRVADVVNNKNITILALDGNEFLDKVTALSEYNPNVAIMPDNLAYVIYTSGSTGNPKGVLTEHHGIVNLAFAQIEKFNITDKTKTLNYAPFIFDASVSEFFVNFLAGGTLVLVPEKDILPGKNLINTLQKYNITFLTLPPSSLRIIQHADLPSLKTLISAAEPCSLELISYWADKVHFYNGYGPTECSVCTTIHPCNANDKKITIGKPINNVQVYILDEHLEVCPIGVTGEIFIGGEGLARGYLNLPELNEAKFIKNPLIAKYKDSLSIDNFSERLYRTGDLARWLPNGDIEYLGRIDNQVKIRGFRIELDDINQQINQQPDIIQGVAVVKKDRVGNSYLSAYIQLKDQNSFNLEQFRLNLKKFLPNYMIPDDFIILDNFPTTFSGKIDMQQLLKLENTKINYTKSSISEVEIKVKEILGQLFEIDSMELDTNRSFFDIGLHSFMLLQFCNEINLQLKVNLAPTDLFIYPNISALANIIKANGCDNNLIKDHSSYSLINDKNINNNTNDHIAIIAMDGKFPDSDNVNEFWQNLIANQESISDFTDEELIENGICNDLVTNANYVKRRGILKDIEFFDSYFFEQSPNESVLTDPQHRIFLEISSNALEKAGYNPDKFTGKIGVFAGCLDSSYQNKILYRYPEFLNNFDIYQIGVANSGAYLSTKVSYKLNLTGPSLNINTACSTSLVTVIEACEQLNRHTCDLALAGGVSISFPQQEGYLYTKEGILSADGYCRAFSDNATGTVASNGAGVVVLKRLNDAIRDRDHIEAVIIGYAVNNDARERAGFTAPSAKGQAECIYAALKKAAINPEDISYIETHGTGTKIGDPIEIKALTEAFRAFTTKTQFCSIGSLKTNIGHTYCASGIAGLIKTALVVKHNQIPPTLHFNKANTNIDFQSSPFYVNKKLISCKNNKLSDNIASVSSFGFGGTNAHLILKEYKETPQEQSITRKIKILTISAKTVNAINNITKNLANFFIENKPAIADAAFTLNTGRREFNHRRIFVCETGNEFIDLCANDNKLISLTNETRNNYRGNIAFMFPGQGSQYPNMALGLYKNEPFFKEIVDKCCKLLNSEYNIDLIPIIFPTDKNPEDSAHQLEDTLYSQTSLFVIEYALAKLFINWGIKPQALIGHSFGEYTAACIAESITLADTLFLIVNRAKLLQKLPLGAMLSLNLQETEITKILPDNLAIAAINAPSLCVISGDKKSLDNFIIKALQTYANKELNVKFLKTNKAFHSKAIDLILNDYLAILQQVSFTSPKIPIFSTFTGKEIGNEITDKEYWLEQMRYAVHFSDTIKTLVDKKFTTFIEMGPGNSLSSLTKLNLNHNKDHAPVLIINSLIEPKLDNAKEHSTAKTTYLSLAKLWLNGISFDWNKFYQNEANNRIELPTYPFDKQYCWPNKTYEKKPNIQKTASNFTNKIDNKATLTDIAKIKFTPKDNNYTYNNIELFLIELFEEILGIQDANTENDFFDCGGDSLSAAKLITKIKQQFSIKIELMDIYASPTIKDLTAYILDEIDLPKKITQLNSLIPIKLTGNKAPLIFIHPIGGAIFCYLPLIKLLEKLPHPIYCIQDPFILKSKNVEFKNIHEVASFYIKKIEDMHINQPYNLIGSSYGGSIAWEITKQLTDNNKKISNLILLDSWAKLSEKHNDFATFIKIMQKHYDTLNLHLENQSDFISEKKSLLDLQWQRMQLLLNHTPSVLSPIQIQNTNITLFKAKDLAHEYICIDDPKNHWQEYCQDKITSYITNGDHESILKKPNIELIAKNLIAILSDK